MSSISCVYFVIVVKKICSSSTARRFKVGKAERTIIHLTYMKQMKKTEIILEFSYIATINILGSTLVILHRDQGYANNRIPVTRSLISQKHKKFDDVKKKTRWGNNQQGSLRLPASSLHRLKKTHVELNMWKTVPHTLSLAMQLPVYRYRPAPIHPPPTPKQR